MPRLPAEWESQSALMLTWPHADTAWAHQLARVERLWTELALAIARYQTLLVVCRDLRHRANVRVRLAAAGLPAGQVSLAVAPSDDAWARDHGPITIIDAAGRPEMVDFRFNAWGGKYGWDLDDRITPTLHAAGAFGSLTLNTSPLTLEGGAIETDGAGTLLAVARTIMDPERNPGWSKRACESELTRRLGLRRFLWLEHGALSGDDTDGHIDTLARFCAPDTLCYVQSTDPGDPDHPELVKMEREIRALTQADGRPYRLIPLPCPAPIYDPDDGHRLPASYANFLMINGAVLMPTYADPADRLAADRLAGLFPGRVLLTLDCRPLIRQGGSLHCITMHLPRGVAIRGEPVIS